MKQYITITDLNELSEKEKKKLRKWWKPKVGDRVANLLFNIVGGNKWRGERILENGEKLYDGSDDNRIDYPLLSIGQMIEFLDEEKHPGYWDFSIQRDAGREGTYLPTSNELCDALWEAVKEILDKPNN